MFTLDSHPRGLRYLYAAVAGHCFAWYVLYNLFVLWQVSQGVSDTAAAAAFGNLVVAAYLMPLLGGVVADGVEIKWRGLNLRTPSLGFRNAALLGSLCGLGGFAALALSAPLLPSVALVAFGVGLLKPALASMVGRMLPSGSIHAPAAFAKYYSFINVGAVASPIVGGWLSESYGYRWAFAAAIAGYVVCAVALLLGRRYLAVVEQKSSLAAALGDVEKGPGYAEATQPDDIDPTTSRRRLVALWIFFALAALAFWPAYAQNGSGLNLWALQHTDRSVSWHGHAYSIPAAWFAAVNAVLCIAASSWLVRRVSRYNLSLSTSTAVGYLLMAASFLVLVEAPQTAAHGGYLVAAIALSSFSEILISTIGLAQVAKLAPRAATSTYMALWYCTVAVGGKLAGMAGTLRLRSSFVLLAAVCVTAAALTVLLRRRLDVADNSIAQIASKQRQEALRQRAAVAAATLARRRATAQTVRLLDDVIPIEGAGIVLLQGMLMDVVDAHTVDNTTTAWWCRRQGDAAQSEWLVFVGEAEVVRAGCDVAVGVGEGVTATA